jgi:predicted DNA-binding transcriptional regulator AlpA
MPQVLTANSAGHVAPVSDDRPLSVQEAAQFLGGSRQTVYL